MADETKAILDGMKTFESDVLYTWENPQDGGLGSYGELGNPFYYETWALAETFVRAEHEKSYDLLQMYKAKADPENPLMVIELNTYTDEGAYIFPSYQNALRYTVSYQFLPEDQDKFGTDKGIGFGTPITYYLNEEEAGSVSGFVKSKELRRVYPGTYQFKLDGHENSEYKIGKSDASGYEFSALVPNQDVAFTGKVIIGLGAAEAGDLVLYGYPDKDNYPHGKNNDIVIMQGLIGASDGALSLETINALTNPNKE